MELQSIEGVEILATGRYALETGETEFTAEHLADAVRATSDPTIVAPRIKLGHDFDKVFGDAAPAFGKVKNMRLTNNGQKIVGDLVDVPRPLAQAIASHYPGRSIEGGFDFDAPSGNNYKLVISDLALLGTSWPGVTNLKDLSAEDLLEVITANGKVERPVEVDERYRVSGGSAGKLVAAKLSDEKKIAASLNVAEFRKVFARDLTDGRVPTLSGVEMGKCWARSVEAGDDGRLALVLDDEAGHLIELPVEVQGDGLKYDVPRLREAVAASSGSEPRVLASWPSKGGSPSTEEERQSMKRDEMLKRLGLPEDASDEAIVAAAAEKPDALTAEAPATETEAETEEADVTDGATLVTASGKKIALADGMVIVDKDTFEEVRAGAKAGTDLAKRAAQAERDDSIKAAITEGKFAVGRREHYEKAWDADPEGTRELLASLQPGLVPVQAIGRDGEGEGVSGESEDALVAAAEAQLFPELAASHTSTLARVIATTSGGAS